MSVDTITNNTQYLTFKLSNEIYALEIAKVREVLDMTTITKVPQTPEFMLGVINLRGGVVPVIDMRLKFGLDKGQKTVNTCIIIMEVTIDQETTIIGALVDSVQEVLDLEPGQLEPPPRIGTRLKIEFIKAMGKWKKQFIIILDIDRIFSLEELSILQEIEKEDKAN
ncbi:MAG: purine-binding chemotaxis protein CheW [Candidatus Delongbacteria bacterium]|nr:purine-binding chemotaxis protein CheW [Candidatus Delongbacteria bacterium]